MSNSNQILDIQLLDRKLQLKVPTDRVAHLQQAAYYLDSKMREISDTGTATGNERIALMAALNISYELISANKQKDSYLDSLGSRITALQDKVDDALAPENETLF